MVALAACTQTYDREPRRHGLSAPIVAVYFYDGEGLSAEYRPLPSGDPVVALVEMLARGPRSHELVSAVPPEARARDVFEAKEGFLIEMSEPFWTGDDAAVRRAAAQIVFTLATLEEGQRITFFDGLVPGAIPAPDGTPLDQPVTRADFGELRPWIEVAQPVAGAVVGRSVPVRLRLRAAGEAVVTVAARGETLARKRIDEDDSLRLPLINAEEGTITITTTTRAGSHTVEIPVRFPPP